MNTSNVPIPSLAGGASWIANHWHHNTQQEPYRWRAMTPAWQTLAQEQAKINPAGLDTLFISGSTPLTPLNIRWLKKTITHNPIYIIDLRQETHLYINELPISMFYKRNEINWGKSAKEIEHVESQWVQYLRNQPTLTVHRFNQLHAGFKIPSSPEQIKVNTIATEQEVITLNGLHYFRIEVPDYHPPSPVQVDYFLNWIKTIPANSWLHFHCAGGKGRTTTFMVMTDILHNAEKITLHDIATRHAVLSDIDVLALSQSVQRQPWKKDAHQARIRFIELFYTYIHSQAYHQETFQSWVKKQPYDSYHYILTTAAYAH